jgi:hypothetical protein
MGLLFRSLDFSHGEGGHSLLRQKGDGIKARHIPELLRYINEKESGKSYFIWGFEEPENSLDFASAESETKTFSRIAARADTQIFITSHSPAFYLAEAETRRQLVRRFFVNRQTSSSLGAKVEPSNAVVPIDTLADAELRMAEASLMQLPYLIRQWSDLKEQNERLQELGSKLQGELESARTPILYVEGKHDKALFEWALKRAHVPARRLTVKTLGGTPKDTADLLLSVARSGGSVLSCPVMFLFDNDKAGRQAYANLCKDRIPGEAPKQINENLSVWALPISKEVKDFASQYGIPEECLFFVSEFLFDGGQSSQLCRALMSDEQTASSSLAIHDSYHRTLTQEIAAPLRNAVAGTPAWLWSRGVPDEIKQGYLARAMEGLDGAQVDAIVEKVLEQLGLTSAG